MIAILGGGVAGASLAWALTLRGRRDVVVFDPGAQGAGSTGAALGGFRTQQGSPLNIALSLVARPFFESRADRIGFEPVGYLYLAETRAATVALVERAELQRGEGLPIEHPDPRPLAPFLNVDDVLGTNFCELDGTYVPLQILGCLIEEASERGAEFRFGCAARPADLEADAVVVCAGAGSRGAGEQVGVSLAVDPVERGIYQVGPFDWLPPQSPVVLDVGSGFHLRQRDRRLLVIGPVPPNDWEPHARWLAHRVPAAAGTLPEEHWTGNYEVTFDHHPLAGRTERDGVWAMCGFSGHGVMHSPAVAGSLAAMILGETPPLDIGALDPLRTEPLHDDTQL